LFRIVSKHSFNLPRTPGSSENNKNRINLHAWFKINYLFTTHVHLHSWILILSDMMYVILRLDSHTGEKSHVQQNLQHGFF
jgi:hypothetical protein